MLDMSIFFMGNWTSNLLVCLLVGWVALHALIRASRFVVIILPTSTILIFLDLGSLVGRDVKRLEPEELPL